MNEPKPDVEIFFMQERGYSDAKDWALDHGLCFRQDLCGDIRVLEDEAERGRGFPAVMRIWFDPR